jgi:hypothetical protein
MFCKLAAFRDWFFWYFSATAPKREKKGRRLCVRAAKLKLPKTGSFSLAALTRHLLTAFFLALCYNNP